MLLAMSVGVVLCAFLGLAAGYLAACGIALGIAQNNLRAEAEWALNESVAMSTDAHSVLDKMNASKATRCSDQDLSEMVHFLYQSRFLKEAGRILNKRVACSTTAGRIDPAKALELTPNEIGSDGVKVYTQSASFILNGKWVTSLQMQDAFIVLNPYIDAMIKRTIAHRSITVIGSADRSASPHPTLIEQIQRQHFTDSGDLTYRGAFYSTRCSDAYNTCMTMSLPFSEALEHSSISRGGFAFVGSLIGAVIGFFLSLAFWRGHSLERQLRRAIQQEDLRLVYQPIVDILSGRIVGAEALCRWNDEHGMAISPDIFVRIAEEAQFVGEITRFVVKRSLQEFAADLRGNPEFHLGINITAQDLSDPGFLPMIEHALLQAGVSPKSLAMELTESSLVRSDRALETIRELRRRGHLVHIDDFGTGYSSLSYLQHLEVDIIKIDKAFTQAIGTEAVTEGILPLIISLAERLRFQVVVEGLETLKQVNYFHPLSMSKPILGQGWIFGKPVPAEEFLSKWKKAEEAERILLHAE
jgi:sensor c-di-GMP phosphodiesterase-like protein